MGRTEETGDDQSASLRNAVVRTSWLARGGSEVDRTALNTRIYRGFYPRDVRRYTARNWGPRFLCVTEAKIKNLNFRQHRKIHDHSLQEITLLVLRAKRCHVLAITCCNRKNLQRTQGNEKNFGTVVVRESERRHLLAEIKEAFLCS